MSAYYNEHDPFAAAWLRELIAARLIAPGEVDERDIQDVRPDDLRSFRQCHFFAGIGVWSYALRKAGWPDDRHVWTGSCPCQPFSPAGARAGFSDERHLWPHWHHLIRELRPGHVFGEQVASKDGYAWLDLVQTDMEALGYAFGPVVLPTAGFGAPHARHRTFFVGLAYADMPDQDGRTPGRQQSLCDERHARTDALVDAESEQAWLSRLARERRATGGYWADADWIPCRGDRWRPIEPGTFPLAPGAPARMGRIRGYGNAINAEVATGFIEAVMDVMATEQERAAA